MTTRPLLIGLAGRAGSGKDTVAAYLADRNEFQPLAFADPIRDMLGALLGHVNVDGAWMVERSLKEQPIPVLGVSYRHMAQTLGTEWGRSLATDFWLRIAMHRIEQCLAMGDSVVLTDVRFANEAGWIRRKGGVIVELLRDASDLPPVRAHASERALEAHLVDYVVFNHGSKATLYEQVDRVVDHVRSKGFGA